MKVRTKPVAGSPRRFQFVRQLDDHTDAHTFYARTPEDAVMQLARRLKLPVGSVTEARSTLEHMGFPMPF